MSNLTMSPVMQKQSVQSNQSTTVKPKPLDSKQAKELANTYRDQGKYNVADSLERATLRSGLSTVPTPNGDVQVNSLSENEKLLGGQWNGRDGYQGGIHYHGPTKEEKLSNIKASIVNRFSEIKAMSRYQYKRGTNKIKEACNKAATQFTLEKLKPETAYLMTVECTIETEEIDGKCRGVRDVYVYIREEGGATIVSVNVGDSTCGDTDVRTEGPTRL